MKEHEPPFSDLTVLRPSWLRSIFDLQYSSIKRTLKRHVSKVAFPGKPRILDVGAGEAPWRDLFPSSAEYQTLDTSPLMISDYQSLSEIPATERFDVVLLIEVLEHMDEPQKRLVEMRDLLKDQGEIWLSVPFAARVHRAPEDYGRWTPAGLRKLLADSDLNVEQIETRGSDIESLASHFLFFLYSRKYSPWILIAPIALLLLGLAIALRSWASGGQNPLGYFVVASKREATKK